MAESIGDGDDDDSSSWEGEKAGSAGETVEAQNWIFDGGFGDLGRPRGGVRDGS